MTRIVIDKSGVINSIYEDDDEACVLTLKNVGEPTESEKEAWTSLQAEIVREFKAGAITGENWCTNGTWIDVDFLGNKRTFRIPAIPSPIGVGDFRTWGQKGWPERVECGAHHNTRHPI